MADIYTSMQSPEWMTWAESPIAGCDISATITVPREGTKRLGNLSLLSISTHMDKFPVTSLGRIAPRGFTYSHRMVGGSLMFSFFDKSILYDFGKSLSKPHDPKKDTLVVMPDELPPFDVNITMVSESGLSAWFSILGLTLLDEGMTLSINDIVPTEAYSYMAMERTPLVNLNSGIEAAASRYFNQWEDTTEELYNSGVLAQDSGPLNELNKKYIG